MTTRRTGGAAPRPSTPTRSPTEVRWNGPDPAVYIPFVIVEVILIAVAAFLLGFGGWGLDTWQNGWGIFAVVCWALAFTKWLLVYHFFRRDFDYGSWPKDVFIDFVRCHTIVNFLFLWIWAGVIVVYSFVSHNPLRGSEFAANGAILFANMVSCAYWLNVSMVKVVPEPQPDWVVHAQEQSFEDVTDADAEFCQACAICLEAFDESDRVLQLTCRHTFHKTCGSVWFSQQRRGTGMTCPYRCPAPDPAPVAALVPPRELDP